jgi:predicted ATPase/class 3 adenylate cyclase
LFTDIEGSTDLAQKFPDALAALLARHHAILRQAIQTHDGAIFQMIGDAFCAAFHTAPEALAAALDAQRMLHAEKWDPAPVRVRMGCNTGAAQAARPPGPLGRQAGAGGSAERAGGVVDNLAAGYEGYSTLARAQRVMSAAHGGQILLSNASTELVRDSLPAGISLRDLGEHKLKGLMQRERLWQVVAPDLPQDFAPLQTLDTVPNNLPGALNRFVGRAHELREVKERLAQARLLTLLGPGGTGKTRLALQVARDLLVDFEDRVYFVDLALSRDSDSVLAAIARTLGLREKSDQPLLEELKVQIKSQRILSLLDNFEQVTVAAPTVAELLRDCPELKMLVTSREALHVRGEVVYPVPPLGLPHFESRQPSLAELAQSEAVQFFVERAQAVKPDFQLTVENAPAVAEICARLDGLPLAIELATARLNVFTPRALSERLGNRLKLLRGGARDLPERQQTLRDTIDWSYEMLDVGEQDGFKLLALFAGATLGTVEAVASQIARFEAIDVFEAVASLADKSLIRQTEEANGESRLRMLETIREFAAARLEEDPDLQATARRAHATFFADFTGQQWARLRGDGREAALTTLASELENIQSAWRYWAAEGNLEQLGKLTDSLWLLYDARGWYHATVELTTELLRVLATTVSTPERAREEIMLQTSLARALLVTKGFTEEVEQAYARALKLSEAAGEIPQMFPVLRGLASFYTLRMEWKKAVQMGERILDLAERLDDPDMEVEGHVVLGASLAFIEDVHIGLEHLEKAIAGFDPTRKRARRFGFGTNPGVIGLAVSGLLLWMIGYPERAQARATESIALARKLNHPFSICYALHHCGLLNLWLGSLAIAEERTREVVDLAEEHGFPIWGAVASCVRGAAMVGLGRTDEGLALIEGGVSVYRGLKSPPVFWPDLLQLLAGAYGATGRPADGLPLLDSAMRIASEQPGRLEAPEFLGLKGDLLLTVSPENAAEAEGLYRQAVEIAREVRLPMFELRAALRLARLWRAQGKTKAARNLLGEAYAELTEGFTMPDLMQAQALLAELA